MNIPELLAPAGTFEKMEYAFAYGADAVYAGIPRFSLRARENDFTEEKYIRAVQYARQAGKKLYLTMNIFPHNRKVDSFSEMLQKVAALKPDGLIMADPGMIMVARENHPELPVHLSTQANTINWQTVRFWQKLGVKRIILSRELSLEEIKEIRQHVPDIELETFVHGAICIAYSGRCLLSNYFTHRDANQGTCSNACRWEYNLHGEQAGLQNEMDRYQPQKLNYYLEETERPGQLMAVDEDEHGTYIMNAKDLSTIQILKDLIEAGVDSIKIEGRTKSHYYLSVVTRAYRWALDRYKNDQEVSTEILNEVFTVSNRGYVTGFLERNPVQNGQNYEESHSSNQSHFFAGLIADWNADKKLAQIKVRNRFAVGDQMELLTPEETISFQLKEMFDVSGKRLQVAHGGGVDIFMALPKQPGAYAMLRRVQKKGNHEVAQSTDEIIL